MSETIFALLTDFGLNDPYVAQMKSVLLAKAPGCTFLDISHQVLPQEILQAGFFLAATFSYLPGGTVCLAVVDPGVGTQRRILVLEKQGRTVLAPDNGLLGLLLAEPGENRLTALPPGPEQQGVSRTFHGRDLFAPLAADLAHHGPRHLPGRQISPDTLVTLSTPVPRHSGSSLTASVVHVDRFGNCVLNLRVAGWASLLRPGHKLTLILPARERVLVVDTYAWIPDQGVGLLQGSQGYYELACNRDSCAERLGLAIGYRITLEI